MAAFALRKQFLFVHADDKTDFARQRTRSKQLDTAVRRHLMKDIGKSRRKVSRAHQYDTHIWSLSQMPKKPPVAGHIELPFTQADIDHANDSSRDLSTFGTGSQFSAQPITVSLTFRAMSLFEQEWGEDSFSAYGLTLFMLAGESVVDSAHSMETFWFPFAFRRSKFLNHYKKIFDVPEVLISLYQASAKRMRSLALERSLETIQCVERRLSSVHTAIAASDDVIHAVLALISYNFITRDFDQAMIHISGLKMVVTARGGIFSLRHNPEMMQMISWVDITAALLHDTKPLFPLPVPETDDLTFLDSSWTSLPSPLISIICNEYINDQRFRDVIACVAELSAIAALVEERPASDSIAILSDQGELGRLMSRLTHRLLSLGPRVEPVLRFDIISEALRLGALIWVIHLKRECRSYPSTSSSKLATLLQLLFKKKDADRVKIWDSPDLRLVERWLFVLCGVGQADEDLEVSARMVASGFEELQISLWTEAMEDVRQMPWLDILEPSLARFELHLLAIRDGVVNVT